MSDPTPDVISAALRAHQTLALRSENHRAYGALFVDLDELHVFDTPDWQVIYGRRGTGKTFLLRVLEEKLKATVEFTRALPLYISAHDLLASPVSGAGPDHDRERAFAYFQVFLEHLAHKLADAADYLVARGGFLATVKRDRQKTIDEVNAIVRDLVSHVNAGVPLGAYLATEYAETVTSSTRATRSLSSGLAGRVSSHGADASATGAIERRTSQENEAVRSTERHGPTVQRLDTVRAHLTELAAILRLESIVVLIDEWSVIDPTALTSIQPWFATLLRRALGGSPTIAVKIATSRYQARFAGRSTEPPGLEIGADLFEGVNLDRALLSQNALEEFYEAMLFKRLVLREPRMTGFARVNGKPSKRFVHAMFRDRQAFEDLVIGSEGNPRNFLATFGNLARYEKWSVRPRWTRDAVERAIREQTLAGLEPVGVASDAGMLLEACVEQVVRRKGQRNFRLRSSDAERWASALEELLDRRLINERSAPTASRGRRGEFRAYQLAYGLWLDVERTREAAGSGPQERSRGDGDEGIVVDLGDINAPAGDTGSNGHEQA
jgi:hypothetical protein